MGTVNAISLWQPWATLIAIGAKTIETRKRRTDVRGVIAIHAAKRWTRELRGLCSTSPFREALEAGGPAGRDIDDLPLGAIVATCRLVHCLRIPEAPYEYTAHFNLGRRTVEGVLPPSGPERAFGNYAPGRWAWILADVRPLPEPIPYTGKQGWMHVDEALLGGGVHGHV